MKITVALALVVMVFTGCRKTQESTEPPPAVVEHADLSLVKVDHPEQFPVVTAAEHKAERTLTVTGVVSPDVARTVPVISLASGRVVETRARLGDEVHKGQVLLRVQSSDVSGAFSGYRKAVNDERLARTQLERAQALYEHGAIAQKDLQAAEDAEQDAQVDLDTTTEQLRLLGVDKDHPTGIVDVVAPVAGIITDQQVVNAGGVQGLSGPNPFTISDLSRVWIICDVYENDLPAVHMGQYADIHVNAYPNEILKGRIENIQAILDPNLRTAKVRLEVANPGFLRIGMFVTATFHGEEQQTHAGVPATAVLHLHDRDWVYVAVGGGQFRRTEVVGGGMLPGNQQEIVSGLQPGQPVASNALELQNTVEQ
jgi:cobalt-zinc-cadmium efflux system membrane fusion protein